MLFRFLFESSILFLFFKLTSNHFNGIIKLILSELEPCAISEILDYLRSDFFYLKG